MKKKGMLWRTLVAVIVLSLMLPHAALAADAGTKPVWQFNDISGHWAKKYIEKMGLMGITTGYSDGSFRPNGQITHEEAVIMTIRMLNVEDELSQTSEIHYALNVSPNAKPYIDYAVTKRIIHIPDEMAAYGSATADNEWGRTRATREWIAKLIVRAIGKQAEAEQAAGQATGFNDDASISSGYRGYINVVKQLGIVSGDNNGNFNSRNPVTRAEMAIFISNSEKFAEKRNPRVVSGTVLSHNAGSIAIQGAQGVSEFSVAADAVYYREGSNAAIDRAQIGAGDNVTVTQHGNTAYHIEKLNAPAVQYKTVTGVLENISKISQTILLSVDGKEEAYFFSQDIQVLSAAGTGMAVSSLIPGSTIELRLNETDEVVSIVVKKELDLRTFSGTIERIVPGSHIVELKEATTGEKQLLQLSADTEISGERKMTGIEDLHIGDEVTVTLRDGVVTSMLVTKSVVTVVEGKVFSVDSGTRLIHILEGTGTVGYFVLDGAAVSITGITSATLHDVQKDDEVLLELNNDNRVQKIFVRNRSIQAKLGLIFYDYYPDSNSITIGEKGKKPEVLEISNDTVFEYNGLPITSDKIKDYFTKDKKVDAIFSGDRIIKLSYSMKYTGTVTEIAPLTNTIKINADLYGSQSFSYTAYPYVELFGKSSTSLADVRVGDRVQLMLDQNQDKVQSIQIMQTRMFKVKDKLSYKLTVQDEKGSTFDIHSVTSATVTHYDKLYATYNDIAVGQHIMVTLTGTMPTSIYVPKQSFGVVDSIDTARGTFVYTEYGQSARTISNNLSVTLNNNPQDSINGLKAGDRIQLIEGNEGMRWITTLTREERSFDGYNETMKTVSFKIRTINDTRHYYMIDQPYIHKAGEKIDIKTLKGNDKLVVYYFDGKVVEIEKK